MRRFVLYSLVTSSAPPLTDAAIFYCRRRAPAPHISTATAGCLDCGALLPDIFACCRFVSCLHRGWVGVQQHFQGRFCGANASYPETISVEFSFHSCRSFFSCTSNKNLVFVIDERPPGGRGVFVGGLSCGGCGGIADRSPWGICGRTGGPVGWLPSAALGEGANRGGRHEWVSTLAYLSLPNCRQEVWFVRVAFWEGGSFGSL